MEGLAAEAPGIGDAIGLPPLAESVVVKLVYRRRVNGEPWVQKIEVKVENIDRIYDSILLAWGKSKNLSDIDFFIAIDEVGGFLATSRGLLLHVGYALRFAKTDIEASLANEPAVV